MSVLNLGGSFTHGYLGSHLSHAHHPKCVSLSAPSPTDIVLILFTCQLLFLNQSPYHQQFTIQKQRFIQRSHS